MRYHIPTTFSRDWVASERFFVRSDCMLYRSPVPRTYPESVGDAYISRFVQAVCVDKVMVSGEV